MARELKTKIPGENRPATPDEDQPAAQGEGRPATQGEGRPAIPGKDSANRREIESKSIERGDRQEEEESKLVEKVDELKI